MKVRSLLLLVLCLGALLPAAAQPMNYQGRLTDSLGGPREGQATLTFSLWTAPSEGDQVWGDFLVNVDLIDGRFAVKLGDAEGDDGHGVLLSTAFAEPTGPRFLQITVGNDSPLPRQEVLPAPVSLYAVRSGHAETAGLAESAGVATFAFSAFSASSADTADFATSAETLLGTIETSTNAENLRAADRRIHISGTATIGPVGAGTNKFSPDGGVPGLMIETTAGGETAGFFINGNTAALWNPGDGPLLSIYDEDVIMGFLNGVDPTPADFEVHKSTVRMGRYTHVDFLDKLHNAVGSLQEETLRIVRGRGTANTTVNVVNEALVGSGFTYKKLSSGTVEVRFVPPFTGTPTVTATAAALGGVAVWCQISGVDGNTNADRSGFTIVMYDPSTNRRDWPFDFIAVGPR